MRSCAFLLSLVMMATRNESGNALSFSRKVDSAVKKENEDGGENILENMLPRESIAPSTRQKSEEGSTEKADVGIAVSKRPAAQSEDDERIEIIVLTDRIDPTQAVLTSVCENSERLLRFHVVVPDRRAEVVKSLLPQGCKHQAVMTIYLESALTKSIRATGLPITWEIEVPKTEYTVHVASWDSSAKHNSVFNCLRFYLPVLTEFAALDRIIFLDDDIVLNNDVAMLWDRPQQTPISAGCLNWVWNECGRMEASYTLNYVEVPYLGFGEISARRSVENATCKHHDDEECAPPGFFDTLANASKEIYKATQISLGRDSNDLSSWQPFDLQKLQSTKAWNFGLNLFVLSEWRAQKLGEQYIFWIQQNAKYGWFPTYSLSYGLGIPFLALANAYECIDDTMPILHGLGFVEPDDFRLSSLEPKELNSYYALHWNGDRKAWNWNNAITEYADYFLRYTTPAVRNEFYAARKRVDDAVEASQLNEARNFFVWTAPRSGSEWFMSVLDGHPNVCASGETQSSGRGWPREALLPLREATEWADVCQPKSLCHWSIASRLIDSMLDEAGASATTLPHMCTGFHSGNISDYYGTHLESVCAILELAMARKPAPEDIELPWHARLMRSAFRIYLNYAMGAQTPESSASTNDTKFAVQRSHFDPASVLTKSGLKLQIPCLCPMNTTVTGLKLMNGWFRIDPERPHESAVYGTAQQASPALRYGFNMTDFIEDAGAKIVVLDRINLISSYVSLRIGQQVGSFHCTGSDCKHRAFKVYIQIDRMMQFLRATIAQRMARDALLESLDVQVLYVEYESCVAKQHRCFGDVLNFLQVADNTRVLDALLGVDDGIKRDARSLRDRIINYDEVLASLQAAGFAHLLVDVAETERPPTSKTPVSSTLLPSFWRGNSAQSLLPAPTASPNDREKSTTHLLLMSDRAEATAATLTSVCVHAKRVDQLVFHLVVPDRVAFPVLSDLLPDCAGATFQMRTMHEVESEIFSVTGEAPVWKQWNLSERSSAEKEQAWGKYARDRSAKHTSSFNLARFYMPLLSEFEGVARLILLDDDIVLQDDIYKAVQVSLREDEEIVMASCQNWIGTISSELLPDQEKSIRMVPSHSLGVFETPHFGFRPVRQGHPLSDAFCRTAEDVDCMPLNFLQRLTETAHEVHCKTEPENDGCTWDSERWSARDLEAEPAWNFGLAAIDIDAWRANNLTTKYHEWALASERRALFPPGSLAHGLGLAYLALQGHVKCWEATFVRNNVIDVLQGLGYVTPQELVLAELTLDRAYALHFNGDLKPWQQQSPYTFAWDAYRVSLTAENSSTFREEISDEEEEEEEDRQLMFGTDLLTRRLQDPYTLVVATRVPTAFDGAAGIGSENSDLSVPTEAPFTITLVPTSAPAPVPSPMPTVAPAPISFTLPPTSKPLSTQAPSLILAFMPTIQNELVEGTEEDHFAPTRAPTLSASNAPTPPESGSSEESFGPAAEPPTGEDSFGDSVPTGPPTRYDVGTEEDTFGTTPSPTLAAPTLLPTLSPQPTATPTVSPPPSVSPIPTAVPTISETIDVSFNFIVYPDPTFEEDEGISRRNRRRLEDMDFNGSYCAEFWYYDMNRFYKKVIVRYLHDHESTDGLKVVTAHFDCTDLWSDSLGEHIADIIASTSLDTRRLAQRSGDMQSACQSIVDSNLGNLEADLVDEVAKILLNETLHARSTNESLRLTEEYEEVMYHIDQGVFVPFTLPPTGLNATSDHHKHRQVSIGGHRIPLLVLFVCFVIGYWSTVGAVGALVDKRTAAVVCKQDRNSPRRRALVGRTNGDLSDLYAKTKAFNGVSDDSGKTILNLHETWIASALPSLAGMFGGASILRRYAAVVGWSSRLRHIAALCDAFARYHSYWSIYLTWDATQPRSVRSMYALIKSIWIITAQALTLWFIAPNDVCSSRSSESSCTATGPSPVARFCTWHQNSCHFRPNFLLKLEVALFCAVIALPILKFIDYLLAEYIFVATEKHSREARASERSEAERRIGTVLLSPFRLDSSVVQSFDCLDTDSERYAAAAICAVMAVALNQQTELADALTDSRSHVKDGRQEQSAADTLEALATVHESFWAINLDPNWRYTFAQRVRALILENIKTAQHFDRMLTDIVAGVAHEEISESTMARFICVLYQLRILDVLDPGQRLLFARYAMFNNWSAGIIHCAPRPSRRRSVRVFAYIFIVLIIAACVIILTLYDLVMDRKHILTWIWSSILSLIFVTCLAETTTAVITDACLALVLSPKMALLEKCPIPSELHFKHKLAIRPLDLIPSDHTDRVSACEALPEALKAHLAPTSLSSSRLSATQAERTRSATATFVATIKEELSDTRRGCLQSEASRRVECLLLAAEITSQSSLESKNDDHTQANRRHREETEEWSANNLHRIHLYVTHTLTNTSTRVATSLLELHDQIRALVVEITVVGVTLLLMYSCHAITVVAVDPSSDRSTSAPFIASVIVLALVLSVSVAIALGLARPPLDLDDEDDKVVLSMPSRHRLRSGSSQSVDRDYASEDMSESASMDETDDGSDRDSSDAIPEPGTPIDMFKPRRRPSDSPSDIDPIDVLSQSNDTTQLYRPAETTPSGQSTPLQTRTRSISDSIGRTLSRSLSLRTTRSQSNDDELIRADSVLYDDDGLSNSSCEESEESEVKHDATDEISVE